MRITSLVTAIATGVLATSLVAFPAAAGGSGATVWIAHGIPAVPVDVCVNGAEVRSGFRYGNAFKATLPAGDYKVRVRLAHPGTCTGAVVIKQTVGLTNGLNATAVARLVGSTPSLAIFVNDIDVPEGDASITVRHVAVAPKVDVWLNGGTAPAISKIAHGDEVGPVVLDTGVYSFWASRVGAVQPVIGPNVARLRADRAYQILAVGNSASTYGFIVIGQAAS